MNAKTLINKKILAACMLVMPLLSQAEPQHDGDRGRCPGPGSVHDAVFHEGGMPPMDGMPPMGRGDMPPPGHGDMFPGHGDAPPFLHGVTLTEAQDDKVFTILHNTEPLLREQSKRARHSAEAMHEMSVSGQYDEAKLKGLAETHAKAMTEIMVLHARSEHEILALLTPEQRAQMEASKPKFDGCQGPKLPGGDSKNRVNAPQ